MSGFGPSEQACAVRLIELALREDLGERGDVTSLSLFGREAVAGSVGRLVARAAGVVAGLPLVPLIIEKGRFTLSFHPELRDGDPVEAGTPLGRIVGEARDLLTAERTILNFLQHLSGIATLTARFVEGVSGARAKIHDTRKTTPGWRALEKYAVRCGGGANHRIGLFDMVLIKDNHLALLAHAGAADPIALALERARASGLAVEIEVDRLEQLDRVLNSPNRPDLVLLDNFTTADVAEAVRRRDAAAPGVALEVSGGVRLESVRALAATGVDRISVGALTHSAPALDIGLDEDHA